MDTIAIAALYRVLRGLGRGGYGLSIGRSPSPQPSPYGRGSPPSLRTVRRFNDDHSTFDDRSSGFYFRCNINRSRMVP
jgi:hypothetical protein